MPKYLPKKQTRLWTQKNGEKIRICDMGDGHLINTIKLIERVYRVDCANAAENALAYAYSSMTPEGASDAAENAGNQYLEDSETLDGIEEFSPCYTALCLELQRRNLKI